jgi:membrane-associated phospholipid phosphatase
MPWWRSESLHDAFVQANQSFPSAHTATAFGLALCLASLYPQGKGWFFTLASLVAMQRMVAGAHYLSDVLAGAAIGIVSATFVLHHFAEHQKHHADEAGSTSKATGIQPEFGKAA